MLIDSMATTTKVSVRVALTGDLKQTMRIERRKVNTSGMQKEMKSIHTQTTWAAGDGRTVISSSQWFSTSSS